MSKRKTLFATALAAAVGLSALVSIPESAIANDKKPVKDSGAPREIKTRELMAEREGLKLKLYEKWRVGNEDNWKQNGKVILLVHGATWASRCTFDPDPDHGYSMMEMLADAGYDVFAVDLHGYGRSERSDIDWTDAQGVRQRMSSTVKRLFVPTRWVEQVLVPFGYQWGAQPAALFSQKPLQGGRLAGMRYRLTDKAGERAAGASAHARSASVAFEQSGDLDPEFA
ncbi:MAG: alpha/beta hydrolase [Polyangia bacterium]